MSLVLYIILPFFIAFAQQENEGDLANAISITSGPELPNGIIGVTEIQSTWGLRLAIGSGPSTYYEFGLMNSNSNGDILRRASLSVKSENNVQAMRVQLYGGIDYTMVEPTVNTTGEELEDFSDVGGHIGSALLIPISSKSFFRSDMKFTANPGSTLYIGFGFERRFASSNDEDNK